MTKARANLTHWISSGRWRVRISASYAATRWSPCGRRVFSEDAEYAKREYEVTDAELKTFVKRSDAEFKQDQRAGRIAKYKGNLRAAVKH